MVEYLYPLEINQCFQEIKRRLQEPAPAKMQLLTGPRQVGKTTTLGRLEEYFGARSYFISADSPEAARGEFWAKLEAKCEELDKGDSPGIILLDEAQYLNDWVAKLKGLWDLVLRRKWQIHLVATGSSSLQLHSGSKESLAGRFERVTLTHWAPKALAHIFELNDSDAIQTYIQQGGYPAHYRTNT